MKRFLTLLLALCLALSLAACTPAQKPDGTEAPKTEAPETEAPKTEAPETEAPETEATKTEAPETEAPETETPETEAPETDAADSTEIRGTIADGAYENRLLKLRIACPKGWVFYDDDQIAQVNNTTAEIMKDTDIADLIGKNGQMMDMMMSSATGGSLNLIIQPKQAMLEFYNDEQIFTLSEETFRSQFEASGFEVQTYEPVTMKVGGEERSVLHIVMTSTGMDIDEYQIWYRDSEDYMGVLTLGLTDGSDAQPILDGITALD